jgi:hypothetical protein
MAKTEVVGLCDEAGALKPMNFAIADEPLNDGENHFRHCECPSAWSSTYG